jgi:hypothetical protein
MRHSRNSEVERYYFELFRKDFSLPRGEVNYSDKPDVILRGRDTLGVEVTNLYIADGSDQSSEQVQRRRRELVLQRAQKKFLQAGGKKFELSVDFDPSKPIHHVEPVSDALCLLARSLSDAESGQVPPILFEHVEQLRFVYLSATEYPDATWRNVQGYGVPMLAVERLREVVARKSAKLGEYQACDRYWLLVVVDLMDPAQDQQLQWPHGISLGGSRFEKVLVYKPQHREVLEVPQ